MKSPVLFTWALPAVRALNKHMMWFNLWAPVLLIFVESPANRSNLYIYIYTEIEKVSSIVLSLSWSPGPPGLRKNTMGFPHHRAKSKLPCWCPAHRGCLAICLAYVTCWKMSRHWPICSPSYLQTYSMKLCTCTVVIHNILWVFCAVVLLEDFQWNVWWTWHITRQSQDLPSVVLGQ